MITINKPQVDTYFILWNDEDSIEKYHKGVVGVDNCLTSAKENKLTYTNKQEWLDKLDELGIENPIEI